MEKEIVSKVSNQIHTLAFDDSDEIEIRFPKYRSFLIFTEILSVCRKVLVARNLKNLIEKSPGIFIKYTNITYYTVKYINNIY